MVGAKGLADSADRVWVDLGELAMWSAMAVVMRAGSVLRLTMPQ